MVIGKISSATYMLYDTVANICGTIDSQGLIHKIIVQNQSKGNEMGLVKAQAS